MISQTRPFLLNFYKKINRFGFIGAVPQVIAQHGWGAVKFQQPYADIAEALSMFWLVNLVFADAVLSPSGTGNVYMSGTSRVLFVRAKKGIFYSIFGKVNPRTVIPRGVLWLSLLLSVLNEISTNAIRLLHRQLQ